MDHLALAALCSSMFAKLEQKLANRSRDGDFLGNAAKNASYSVSQCWSWPSGAVLIFTHNSLSPVEAFAVRSMVRRASFAGMLEDKDTSKSSSTSPGLM